MCKNGLAIQLERHLVREGFVAGDIRRNLGCALPAAPAQCEDHRAVIACGASIEEVAADTNLHRILRTRKRGQIRIHPVYSAGGQGAFNLQGHPPQGHVWLMHLGPTFEVLVEELRHGLVRGRGFPVAVVPCFSACDEVEAP